MGLDGLFISVAVTAAFLAVTAVVSTIVIRLFYPRQPSGIPSAMPGVLRRTAVDDEELERLTFISDALDASGRLYARNSFVRLLADLRDARGPAMTAMVYPVPHSALIHASGRDGLSSWHLCASDVPRDFTVERCRDGWVMISFDYSGGREEKSVAVDHRDGSRCYLGIHSGRLLHLSFTDGTRFDDALVWLVGEAKRRGPAMNYRTCREALRVGYRTTA